MLDDAQRERLLRAGERFRAAQHEHEHASIELREALLSAQDAVTAEEAATLTGVHSSLTAVLLGRG